MLRFFLRLLKNLRMIAQEKKYVSAVSALCLLIGLTFLLVKPVEAGLTLSIDSRAVFFGRMNLDETKELTDFGGYHNEIRCSSANNTTWYLKVHILRPLSSGEFVIPLENFQWQVVYTNGVGILTNQDRYTAFDLAPNLVYISGPAEAGGSQIRFQFKYKLTIPEMQEAGAYNTVIRYTLTEVL